MLVPNDYEPPGIFSHSRGRGHRRLQELRHDRLAYFARRIDPDTPPAQDEAQIIVCRLAHNCIVDSEPICLHVTTGVSPREGTRPTTLCRPRALTRRRLTTLYIVVHACSFKSCLTPRPDTVLF